MCVSISNIIHVRLIGLCLFSRAHHHQHHPAQHSTNNHHNKLNCQKTCWTQILRWAGELQQNDEMILLVRLPTKLHIFAGLNFSGYKSARRSAARTAGCRVRRCVSLQRAALQHCSRGAGLVIVLDIFGPNKAHSLTYLSDLQPPALKYLRRKDTWIIPRIMLVAVSLGAAAPCSIHLNTGQLLPFIFCKLA